MKVCFLDFDGVLNCQKWIVAANKKKLAWPGPPPPDITLPHEEYTRQRKEWHETLSKMPEVRAYMRQKDLDDLDPLCVARLNAIVEATKCFIVISSSWRVLNTVEYLTGLLVDAGFKSPEHIIGMTDQLGGWRCREIREWILNWDEANGQDDPIESVLVLDDEATDLQPFRSIQVKPTFYEDGGLKDEHVTQAIEILSRNFDRALLVGDFNRPQE